MKFSLFGVPDMKIFFLLKNAYGAGKACNIMLNHAANEFFHQNKKFEKKVHFFTFWWFLALLAAFLSIQTEQPRTWSAGCRNDRPGATTFVPSTPRDLAAFSCGTGFYPYFSLSRSNLPPKLCTTSHENFNFWGPWHEKFFCDQKCS